MNDGLKFPLYCFSFFILITFFLSLKFSVYAEEPAQTLETQITISDGQDASVLKDQYVSSKLTLTPGTQITIESSSKNRFYLPDLGYSSSWMDITSRW